MNNIEIETIENAYIEEHATIGYIQTNKRQIIADHRNFIDIIDHIRDTYQKGDLIPIEYDEENNSICFTDEADEEYEYQGPIDQWITCGVD